MANTITLKISVDKPQPDIVDLTCALQSAYEEQPNPSEVTFHTDRGAVAVIITSIGMESEGSYDLLIGGSATIEGKTIHLRIRYNPKTKVGKIEYDE